MQMQGDWEVLLNGDPQEISIRPANSPSELQH